MNKKCQKFSKSTLSLKKIKILNKNSNNEISRLKLNSKNRSINKYRNKKTYIKKLPHFL